MSTTNHVNHHEPKPPKHIPVQSWENEGGAVPEQVIFAKDQKTFWKRLPVQMHDARRKLARVVLRNPELALGAAIGLGFLIGSRSRTLPMLKALLGVVATSRAQKFLTSIAPGAAESV